MSCKCNCMIKNGSDKKDFLLASETAGVYAFGLTHYTCLNQKMALNDPSRPVQCNLTIEPVGQPIDLGNGIYCQEFLVTGTVTYCPCGSCKPEPEDVTGRTASPRRRPPSRSSPSERSTPRRSPSRTM